jgi:uncharacterized protein YndB with AHSA1/START domain
MDSLPYQITINASPEKVWEALWNKNSYTIWASTFTHGSYADTNFQLGNHFQFLNPDGNGLYGVIAKCVEYDEMILDHQGEVKHFLEILPDGEENKFDHIKEHYKLQRIDNQTMLTATLFGMNDWQSYFDDAFPKALSVIKTIAEKNLICINIITKQPIEKVWQYYTEPNHIVQWNQASPDWHCPKAENDVVINGEFSSTMAAKDGSFSFDFSGKYTAIENEKIINYTMDDGRICEILFIQMKDGVRIVQAFEPETENTIELQTGGWQAIMNSFKTYVESN